MISSWVLLRRRSSLVISLPAKISSNSDLLRRCLLQRRSPPATSAPATISLLRRLLQRRSPPASSLSSCVLSAKSSVSPFCSGSAVAAAASHAFDTTRTRSQCTVLPKYVSMERRLLKWKQPGNKFERYTGIHPSDRNLLFRGLRWRMARSGLASFMIVGSYFFAVDHLASNLT